MSFVINFAAIELSTYLDKWHYIRLGVLILISAVIVTAINKFLVGREKNIIIIPAANENQIENKTESKEPAEKPVEAKPVEVIKPSEKAESVDKPADKLIEPKVPDIKPAEIKAVKKPEQIEVKDVKEKIKPVKPAMPAIKPNEIKKPDKPTISQPDKSNKPNKIEKVENIPPPPTETKTVDKKVDRKMAPPTIKVIEETTDDSSKNAVSKGKKDDVVDEIGIHLGSLDDILDYAYAEKTKGNVQQAILAYQRALNRYQNDDYAPFIAIDLGNIYKEQAAYTRFIKTYEEALKLPVVMRNSTTYNEFAKTLTFMKMVQTVLARHRALTTPFSKIPAQYLQEAETEIKAAQMRTKYK